MRTLHTYDINGIALLAYDQEGSQSADRVAQELCRDVYGFEDVPFAPHDIVLDIGAHVGLVSMYLAKRWPHLRVHAFEPHPANYQNCVDNLLLNDVPTVRVFQRAVTADGRALVLQHLPHNTGGATAVFDMPGSQGSDAVESVTLAEIFDRALAPGQRCRLLKIDCEGMEYEILPSPLLDRIDYFAAEFHEPPFSSGGASGGPGGNGGRGGGRARDLHAACARYFAQDRLRILYCPKHD